MIRKFVRNLLLRCLFLAMTGNEAVSLTGAAPAEEAAPTGTPVALPALDQLGSLSAWGLLQAATVEVVQGPAW